MLSSTASTTLPTPPTTTPPSTPTTSPTETNFHFDSELGYPTQFSFRLGTRLPCPSVLVLWWRLSCGYGHSQGHRAPPQLREGRLGTAPTGNNRGILVLWLYDMICSQYLTFWVPNRQYSVEDYTKLPRGCPCPPLAASW